MTDRFFGYGSLVNRRTHDYAPAHPARVSGWRRVWRGTRLRRLAFLSVEPAPGVEIEGLVAPVPGGDWAALDQREAAYVRHPLGLDEIAAPVGGPTVMYVVPDDPEAPALREHPILLSYLDVVVQGFLDEFGRAGVERFFATTAGWEVPVLDDRASPLYPRAQRTGEAVQAMADAHLARLGARRMTE
ncbi:gamma-glutamylcyclotransferase family protein [Solirhodobacter olei]|uniref:gamma-glutamylcyclotransferase family protein n=1 Tax=Solirhodobacter olei TaxID=2493082 RepID=UPI000FD81B92|nr:gamma-glutamylcyclotransferase family protein [Solirhodobacter olei]